MVHPVKNYLQNFSLFLLIAIERKLVKMIYKRVTYVNGKDRQIDKMNALRTSYG